MVNGGNTSSAATIELDQNDNKLTPSTPELTDYIGFWDESTSLQSKVRLGDLPLGWDLALNGSTQETIGTGDVLNFEEGNNIDLTYTSSTNTLKIDASGAGAVDLYTNDALQEEAISILNIVGDNIGVTYSSPGRVELSFDNTPPPYTHQPDAYVAFNRFLYLYDISEGTAEKLDNAPSTPWTNQVSFGENNYIFTANGTTAYRYDIEADYTDEIQAGSTTINWMVNAPDGIYAISKGECYHIDKSSWVATYYGDTITNYEISAARYVVDTATATAYITIYSESNDRWYYKEVKGTYSGSDSDNWTASSCTISGSVNKNMLQTNSGATILFDVDNISRVYPDFSNIVSGSCGTSNYYTYKVPSGHIFNNSDGNPFSSSEADGIITLEVSDVFSAASKPVSYSIVETRSADDYSANEALGDAGVYVAVDQSSMEDSNFAYEQAVNDVVFDQHVELVGTLGANVMIGADDGTVYFHYYDEDPKQFNKRDVYEVTTNKLHAEKVEDDITFVYFDSTATGDGLDPKENTAYTNIDLHVNNTLEQENIPKIDIIEGTGITATYSGDSGVTISATGITDNIEDIAFDFNDVTGDAQTYIIDLEASYDYDIVEGVFQSDADVAITVDIAGTTTITNTVTSTIQTFTSGDSVTTGDQITLNLSSSSATVIRGKLRIQRT